MVNPDELIMDDEGIIESNDIKTPPKALYNMIALQKASGLSKYEIDNTKIKKFADQCWAMLPEDAKRHYTKQLNTVDIALATMILEESPRDSYAFLGTIDVANGVQNPADIKISKFAFDLNRGLQSAHDEASKNKSNIDDELTAQVSNFKYLNLSNSDLHKKDNLGIFANQPFQNRNPFNEQHLLAATIESALATFPSAELLGYTNEGDNDKFVDTTAAILEGVSMTKDNKGNRVNDDTITLSMGALDGHLTSAVAAYVDKNFEALQKLPKEEQIKIGEAFKEDYRKLHAEQEHYNNKNNLRGSVPLKKLANAFKEVSDKEQLLVMPDERLFEVKIDTPTPNKPLRSSPMQYLRKMMTTSTPIAPLNTHSAVVKSQGKIKVRH